MISEVASRYSAKNFSRVTDEGFAGLIHDGPDRPGGGVHPQNAQGLVSALIEKKGEPRGIGTPTQITDGPGVGIEGIVQGDFLFGFEVEQMGLVDGHGVSRFEVGVRLQLGLELVFGGRLDLIDRAFRARLITQGDEVAGIGGPISLRGGNIRIADLEVHSDRAFFLGGAGVAAGGIAVVGQWGDVVGFDIAQEEVVAADQHFPFPVR